jgi:succinate-acetate transporter protein
LKEEFLMSQDGNGWANPAPAGLFALALADICFYAALSGKIKLGGLALLGMWLLGGFVVQLIVGIVELKNGEIDGGNVFTLFASFFMLTGGFEFIFKYFALINKWPLDTLVDGYAWLALSIIVWAFTPSYFKKSVVPMALLFIAFDIALPIIALVDLGVISSTIMIYAADLCIVGAFLATWTAAGVLVNTAWGRSVIPLGGPMIK